MGFFFKTYKDQVYFDRYCIPGLTPRSLRHHYSLYTLHFCVVAGILNAVYFSARTLIYNPDSLLVRKDNYERYRDGKLYRLFCPSGCNPKSEAPQYRREGDPDDDSYATDDYNGPKGPNAKRHFWIFEY